MIKSLVFALAIAGMSASAVTAYAATAEEQAACRSDAIKYCSAHIGKPDEMGKCLEEHKADLSEACRKVVESHGG
jgi:erythromycin esterase-like protein